MIWGREYIVKVGFTFFMKNGFADVRRLREREITTCALYKILPTNAVINVYRDFTQTEI